MLMNEFSPTERTTLRRETERGSYDKELIYSIIDNALIGHLGIILDDGQPLVIPTIHARVENVLYVHGSAASRTLRLAAQNRQLCFTVTHLDGIVVAKSSFASSMNYRSVVVMGNGRLVDDEVEIQLAMDAIINHVLPGRTDEIRASTRNELRATKIIALDLVEVSAKVRSGGPIDEPEDVDSPTWSGVIPLRYQADDPQPTTQPSPAPGDVPRSILEAVRRFNA